MRPLMVFSGLETVKYSMSANSKIKLRVKMTVTSSSVRNLLRNSCMMVVIEISTHTMLTVSFTVFAVEAL